MVHARGPAPPHWSYSQSEQGLADYTLKELQAERGGD